MDGNRWMKNVLYVCTRYMYVCVYLLEMGAHGEVWRGGGGFEEMLCWCNVHKATRRT